MRGASATLLAMLHPLCPANLKVLCGCHSALLSMNWYCRFLFWLQCINWVNSRMSWAPQKLSGWLLHAPQAIKTCAKNKELHKSTADMTTHVKMEHVIETGEKDFVATSTGWNWLNPIKEPQNPLTKGQLLCSHLRWGKPTDLGEKELKAGPSAVWSPSLLQRWQHVW